MAARNTITIEFVGDTARLVRSSGQASDAISSDMRDAATDAGKSADKMADRFESAFEGIHGRVGTKVGPGFASLGGKLGGKLIGGFAALGIGGVIAGQITESMDITAGVDKLEARLGLTSKRAGEIGELAGDTYAGAWGESMEEVQGFYAETMRAFPKLTDEALKKVTESAATTSDVWDQDFNEVVRAAQNLLVNGLAPDAQTAMDMVATALQKTKGPQDEVLSALREYSDHFAVLGLDGRQVLGGLTSDWATNEFAIDKVGDAIKELGIRTLDGSDTTKQGLEAIGLSVGEVEAAFAKGGDTAGRMTERIIKGIIGIEDPAERARVGVALMGTPFEDLGNNAVPILKDVVEGQKDLTDTVDVGNKAYDNAKTKLESWRRQGLQKLTEFIGGSAIPAVEDFSGEVEDFVKSKHIDRFVGHWVGQLEKWVKDNDDYKARWRKRWRDSLGGWLQDTDDYKQRWASRWERFLGTWVSDTDDWKSRWAGRWNRTLGAWLEDTDDWKERWRGRWNRSLGGWLADTDDWKARWAGRWNRTLGSWIEDTDGYKSRWRARWDNSLGGWLEDTDDWISKWRSRWQKAKEWFKGFNLGTASGGTSGGSFDGIGFDLAGLPGGGSGTLMGISPLSAVGRAYSALGRPGDVISGFRPGARTLSGNLSYHAQGRALDITPIRAIAVAIRNAFGGRTRELITPWRELDLHNGRPHYYSSAVHAQHSGSRAHVHWAMASGGVVNQPGRFLVGEEGPEIVNLKRADMVTPLDKVDWVNDGYGIPSRATGAPMVTGRPEPVGRGTTTIINNYNVHVAGSVVSERDLHKTIRKAVRTVGGL